jgi:hypothetical protein
MRPRKIASRSTEAPVFANRAAHAARGLFGKTDGKANVFFWIWQSLIFWMVHNPYSLKACSHRGQKQSPGQLVRAECK